MEEHHVNRTGWPSGPWDNEPDKIQWKDEATGLPCLIVRNGVGGLCGYVGVAEGHPAFHKPHDDLDLDVHGGLTYSAPCQHVVCHIPGPGEPDDVWWLGFDCVHSGDMSPSISHWTQGVYRDVAYVTNECTSLAAQLKEMK